MLKVESREINVYIERGGVEGKKMVETAKP
jgi:hypothetical protein